MLLNRERHNFYLGLIILIGIIISFWNGSPILAGYQGPNGLPTNNNSLLPINVSADPQSKLGTLTVGRGLRVLGSSNVALVEGKVGISGPAAQSATIDSASNIYLDLGGTFRMRSGAFSGGVLRAADSSGLATWGSGGTSVYAGSGILAFPVNPIVGSGSLEIDPDVVQRRIIPDCINIPNSRAFGAINEDVNKYALVSCNSFITAISTPSSSGLSGALGGKNGAVSLALNVGAGLAIDVDNGVKLNINTASGDGDGLTIDASRNVRFENCTAANPYWYYNSVTDKFECNNIVTPLSPHAPPGDSVMYLRSSNNINPPSCPGSGGWIALPSPTGSPTPLSTYTAEENVGYTGSPERYNRVRVCYKNTVGSCQVVYLSSATAAGVGTCGSLGANWIQVTGGNSSACSNPSCSEEWAPGAQAKNYVRVCYKCSS